MRFAHGGTQVVDAVLVAVWRSPRTADLGLSEAGVEVGDRGYVTVNDRLQTTNPRIWAAGDGVRKAAIADVQHGLRRPVGAAVTNTLGRLRRRRLSR